MERINKEGENPLFNIIRDSKYHFYAKNFEIDNKFIENNKALTTYDINKHSLNFKGMNCYMRYFQLETNGDIHIFCQNDTDNLYKNKNYFKNIKYPMICNRNRCNESSCGLECLKYI